MTEPMKTYHEIKKNLSNKNFSEIGVKSVVELEEKAAQIYAAQQVTQERERIRNELRLLWMDLYGVNSKYAPRITKLIDSL